MRYRILYHPGIKYDLKNLGSVEMERFFNFVNTKISENPFIGKKLQGKYYNLYRARIGSYRVIYKINSEQKTVIILKFGHRQGVYDAG